MKNLDELAKEYEEIIRNKFKSDSRMVFGEGPIKAKVMLIGEAPGKNEEETGKPFVGAAGKNLDEFLDVLKLSRDEIYITNVVKIRPVKVNEATGRKSNRTPDSFEIKESLDVLKRQIEIIGPKIVVTLGNVPLRGVTGINDAKIGDYHGRMMKIGELNVFPLYHPASIIYNRSLKEIYLEDIKKLSEYVNLSE